MILRSIRVRGSIGLMKGIGQEDVTVDFTRFAPGLISVQGPNGSGKTTFLENLSSFRELKSRPGGLARQFYLKDSVRDMAITLNGDDYRFEIRMNPTLAKPAVESFVYKNGVPLNKDGKEETYNELVYKLFGSPKLYYSSLFMAQTRENFSDIKPAEAKDLVLQLIGAGILQSKCDYAAQAAKGLREEASSVQQKIDFITETLNGFGDIDHKITDEERAVKEGQQALFDAESNTAMYQGAVDSAQKIVTDQAVLETQLTAALKAVEELARSTKESVKSIDTRMADLRTDIEFNTRKLRSLESDHTPEKKAAIEARVIEADKAKADYLSAIEKSKQYAEANGRHVSAASAYLEARGKFEAETARLSSAVREAKIAFETAERSYTVGSHGFTDEVNRANRAIENLRIVPCAKTAEAEACRSCQFLQDAVKAEESLSSILSKQQQHEDEWTGRLRKLGAEHTAADKALAEHGVWVGSAEELRLRGAGEKAKAELTALGFDQTEYANAKLAHERFERENPRQAVVNWEAVGQQISTLSDKLTADKSQLESLANDRELILSRAQTERESKDASVKEIEAKIEPGAAKHLEDCKAQLVECQKKQQEAGESLVRHRGVLSQLRQNLDQRTSLQTELDGLREQLAKIQSDEADWNHLSQALSRNGGFQSILVASAGAEMSPFADKMLSLYGRNWTMEIDTAKPTVDGKGIRDGFFVTINTPDGPREITQLSGGEKVTADQVLYDAIANMLRRRSGFNLLTAIRDEADGALDPERARAYLEALRAAHVASGMHHTIIVSHRPELQEAIDQRLIFNPGQGITQVTV